ncbi:MAG: hybrid sensor histidine kinase/response regulator [Gammaproteobacteria bacterium]|nr:hybrid sensor histidine kinase/response regulator [Gammaproteobacteria bacterium]
MITLSLIDRTIEKGFPWLFFPKPLEQEFQAFVRQRILNRILPVGISAALFIIVFSGLDWLLLHPIVAKHTSIIRLGLVLPAIAITTLWLYFKPPKYYLAVYSVGLILANISIIYIIWLAHVQGINLPYEGLMITIMYAFFIMALPFYLALSINLAMVCMYALTEPLFYLNFSDYLNHVIFLSVILVSAAIGAYVTEHQLRANFLRKRTLDIHHQNTLKSIEKKNKYLAAASHDIRQPLQGLSLMSDLIKRDHPHDVNIEHVAQGIATLQSMFNQMLDLSKVNLDLLKPQFDQIYLTNFCHQVINNVEQTAKRKGILLHHDIHDAVVSSDYTLLSRILHNLIDNALQHSQCRDIWVYTDLQDNHAILSIKDNGLGIPESIQQTLFDEFTKGDQSQTGLGLGLAIVSQFCKKLGITLTFESNENGSCFYLTLPISEKLTVNEVVNQNKAKLLLVDDDVDLAANLTQKLSGWGYEVTQAHGLQHGLSLVEQDWDVVISDWNLGDGCGEEIIQYTCNNKIPSVMISTHDSATIRSFVDKVGCAYLQKPISPSRLRASLLQLK